MSRRFVAAACVILAALVPASAAGSLDAEPDRSSYIVVFNADAVRSVTEPGTRPLVAVLAQQLARAHGAEAATVYQHALKGFAVRLAPDRADALATHPRVAYVEPEPLQPRTRTACSVTAFATP